MYSRNYTREELIAEEDRLRRVETSNRAYVKMLNDPRYRKAMGLE